MGMMTKDQQKYLDDLRFEYAHYADAAREFDKLADNIENMGACYNKEAHAEAVNHLRNARDRAKELAENAKQKLKNAEGWQQRR